MTETISGVPSLGDRYFLSGHAMLQNLPSIVCSRVLNPRPGDCVLDMCAAPGNKTTHLAELMSDCGQLIALDKTESKVKLLNDKIRIFELKSVKSFVFDSTKAIVDDVTTVFEQNHLEIKPPFHPETFDKILLDAPCSALGNRPQLRNDISPKMLASYPVVQKKLFKTAVGLLKTGAILVYSTCTINEKENENIVAWALEKFKNIQLVPAEPLLAGPGWPNAGLTNEQR